MEILPLQKNKTPKLENPHGEQIPAGTSPGLDPQQQQRLPKPPKKGFSVEELP